MISVSNVSMRYGAKVLFEDVSTAFTPGKRYGLTGPNGSGKSTFMKLLDRRDRAAEGNRRSSAKARRPQPGPVRFRRLSGDRYRIMGNKRLWTALEERDKIYEKTEMTDADGMRLGELEGIVGEEDGYTAETDAAILLQASISLMSCTNAKWPSCRAAKRSACCWPRPFSDIRMRFCSTSPPTTWISIPSTGSELPEQIRRRADRHLARPPLPEQCLHPHRRHRLRDHHHLHRHLRRHGGGEDAGPLADRIAECAAREENRPAERIHRAVCGRHALQPGQSRRKEVERLQVTELARSNIQRRS